MPVNDLHNLRLLLSHLSQEWMELNNKSPFGGLVGEELGVPHGKNFTESHRETLEGAIYI